MSARIFACVAAAAVAALISAPTEALPISGSFSGTATGDFNNGDGTFTPFAESVTGRFAFSTDVDPPCCSPPDVQPDQVRYETLTFDFSVHIFGRDTGSAAFERYWPDGMTLREEGAEQSLTLSGGGPYWRWLMSFVDADGGLFQDFDPLTFDPNQVDVSRSYAIFSDNIRAYNATVAFDNLTFDGFPGPGQVPEPTTLMLYAAGLLLLSAFARRSASARPARPSLSSAGL